MPQLPRQEPPVSALRDHWQFFASFLRRPWTIGALAPSSACLARLILRRCPLRKAQTVVELGPGTGAITRFIHERIGPDTTFIALDLDPGHVERLRRRYPGVTVCHESAENLGAVLARHRCEPADCIVSGLPFGNMSRKTQDRIIGQVRTSLKPGGRFCGFGYLHASWYPTSRAFREMLAANFDQVHISRVVWRNLPPAFAYSCT
jgi:phosphatidylethanolamine/phosphatidyl-N-methylethanolamine N-methyltransferase